MRATPTTVARTGANASPPAGARVLRTVAHRPRPAPRTTWTRRHPRPQARAASNRRTHRDRAPRRAVRRALIGPAREDPERGPQTPLRDTHLMHELDGGGFAHAAFIAEPLLRNVGFDGDQRGMRRSNVAEIDRYCARRLFIGGIARRTFENAVQDREEGQPGD